MKIDTVSWLLGYAAFLRSPAEDGGGAGGGGAEGDAGVDTTKEGETPAGGTVLGADPGGDKSADDGEKADDAGKGDVDKEGAKDDEGEKGEEKPGEGADEVPEDGVYEFELPEGVELPDDKKAMWSGQFKELGLTRTQAQKLVEMQAEQVVSEQKAFADHLIQKQTDDLAAAKADKDIGGDKWDESARLANLGLKALEGSAIKDMILSSGNGNNPEMIRELRRIGEMVRDDKFEAGASHEEPAAKETSWYGKTTPDTKKG